MEEMHRFMHRTLELHSTRMNKKKTLICILLAAIMLPGFSCTENAGKPIEVTRKAPTCEEAGYIQWQDPETRMITIEDLPPTGHDFGEWEIQPDGGKEDRVCGICGFRESRWIWTDEELKLPRLELYGSLEGINKKAKVTLEASFTGKGMDFSCYAIMSTQGHTTLTLEKPNFTIRFYHDAEGEQKYKLRFEGWQKEHKYILKACYRDPSMSRNLAGAAIWREMVKCRANVPARVAFLPTLGTVDGFPVTVWLNGDFYGLYTLCLHKDNDLFDMEDGEKAALVICNRETEKEALFRAPAELDEENVHDWEMEYCGTEDRTWARESFNELVGFVMNSSDTKFREGLSQYLDVDGAIDYLLFIYALGLEKGGAKDLILVSYGDVWIPSAFDMDEAFGLDEKGTGIRTPDGFLPYITEGTWNSGTGSLLWDRLLQNWENEIRQRYAALRKGPLSEEIMISKVREIMDAVPETLYEKDLEQFPRPDMITGAAEQIEKDITERLKALDAVIGGDR